MHLADETCDCPDARAFRAFLASPAGEALDALAATLAVWKLRSMAHDLAAAADWSRPRVSAAIVERERGQYDAPARTAREIRESTAASWAAFDRGEGPLIARGQKMDAGA